MSAQRIVAVDIGGTNVKFCCFTDDTPSQVQELPTQAMEGAERLMCRVMDALETFSPFDAVGVSTAGQVDPATGSIRYANSNLPDYTGTAVKALVQARFGVPVAVENDVNSAALGEGLLGAAVGFSDYLCLTYGTGVGGAIILGGSLYHGAQGSAGEFGALAVHPEAAVEGDPYSGCYERYASATALVHAAQAFDPALNNGRALFSRIGEAPIQKLVNQWMDEVAIGLCSLLPIFNPSCIVLGGGIMEQPYITEHLYKKVEKRAVPSFLPCHIVSAKLGNMAGLFGAAHLARALLVPLHTPII